METPAEPSVFCAHTELVDIEKLVPNPKNPNHHPAAQVQLLAKIIKAQGFRNAIVVSKRSGFVIKGHGRLEAAKLLKMQKVPVDFQEYESEAAEYADMLADNRIAELAETDKDELRALIQELDGKIDLDLTGFDAEALQELLPPEFGDDSPVPEPPDEAKTQKGDIYILGPHRLMCGDSSSAEDLDKLLGGAVIHLVHTDPPYNVKVEPRSNNAVAAGLSTFGGTNAKPQTHHQQMDEAIHGKRAPTHKKLRAKDRPLANDFLADEDFAKMLLAWFGNIARVLEPGRSFYIWGGYANLGNYPLALKETGLYFSQTIVWDKEHPVLTRKDFLGAFELAFYGWREGAGHQFFGPSNVTDLWHVKKVSPQSMVHLTEKPAELAVRALHYSSRSGENVLDLFGGSGSTLIGAEQTGRKAFLMELDTLYCDVIVQRWLNLGEGRKAMRVREGKEEDVSRGFSIAPPASFA